MELFETFITLLILALFIIPTIALAFRKEAKEAEAHRTKTQLSIDELTAEIDGLKMKRDRLKNQLAKAEGLSASQTL